MARAYMAAIMAALSLVGFAIVGGSVAVSASAPHAVSLTDARRAPDVLRYVRPGAAARVRGRFSNVSAYRWNGRPLGAQRRDVDGWSYWRGRSGRVWWSGREFFNDTRRPVLVAAWRG